MLTIRKLLFDSQGNVDILLKHYSYEIKVKSKLDNRRFEQALDTFGIRLGALTYHNDYSKKSSFKNRCYKLSKYFSMPEYTWFIRDENIEYKEIRSILDGKVFFYNIEVTVCKYSIGLYSISSIEDEIWEFPKVSSLDSKTDLIKLINLVIKAAYDIAREREPYVFSGCRSATYEDTHF